MRPATAADRPFIDELAARFGRFRYVSLNVNDANEETRRFYERRAYEPEYRHLVKLL